MARRTPVRARPSVRPPRAAAGRKDAWRVRHVAVWLGIIFVSTVSLGIAWRSGLGERYTVDERELALLAAATQDRAAIPVLLRLFNENDRDVPVIRALTALGMVADDPEETLYWLDRWHHAAPDDLRPIRLALEVSSRTGRFDAVIRWGDKLLEMERDPVPVLERLVTAELALGRSDDAIRHARQLLARGGTTDIRLVLLARSLFACGRDAEAMGVLEPLCRRDPPDVVAIGLCAPQLATREGPQRVISMLRDALAVEHDRRSGQTARFELARLLRAQGDRSDAEHVMGEWQRIEEADAAARDAYQRPHDAALARKAAALLTATGQATASATLLADLVTDVPDQRTEARVQGRGLGSDADRVDRTETSESRFDDVTIESGIDFIHDGDASARHLIQETMGSGVAWLDYDRDGRTDLFCVQVTTTDTVRPGHRLYRNVGGGRFRDVTESTGVGLAAYGMGVEVGDVDNDGYDDLVVSDLSGLSLLHNIAADDGRRTFVDITAAAGLVNPSWGTGMAFLDADADGLLDLYVTNYVAIDPLHPLACIDSRTGLAQPCSPTAYDGSADRIFRNLGDLRFEDASARWGLGEVPRAAGLGVIALDLDEDGDCDLFVANDMQGAFLLRNTGSGFVEEGMLAGCSHGPNGRLMAGMGVAAMDVDGSGWPSLVLTNFQFQPNVLFRAAGDGTFVDHTYASGLGGPSHDALGFGICCLDVDLDGAVDAIVANGHVNRSAPRISAAPFAQPMQVFLGSGRGSFRDHSASAGAALRTPRVGRGLAACDFDGDGRPDLAVTENGGRVTLLRNRLTSDPCWIQLVLEGDGTSSNRSAIGARVDVRSTIGRQTHFVCGGGSYLSASDRCLTVGLGGSTDDVHVSVTWPSGRRQDFGLLKPNSRWKLVDGEGAQPLNELRAEERSRSPSDSRKDASR